jgi:hypothetical protein
VLFRVLEKEMTFHYLKQGNWREEAGAGGRNGPDNVCTYE